MATTKYLSADGLKYYDSLVKLELDKKQNVITNLDTIAANAAAGAGLVSKVGGIAEGAQVNVIETVKVNGVALTPENKAVNIDLSGKADVATSLAGYGILDAYTKTETDTVVSTAIAKIVEIDQNDKIDTLKEIANWIINDTTGAAKMASDIEDLKSNKQATISDLAIIRSNAETGATFATNHATDEVGSQVNLIETVKVNGVALTITDKAVDIDLAASAVKFSEAQTAAIDSGITAAKVTTYDGYANQIATKLNSADIAPLDNDAIYKIVYPTEQ